MTPLDSIALIFAVVLSIPFVVISIELFAALSAPRPIRNDGADRRRIAVLVPAHNEELCIQRTIETASAQLSGNDRLVVIADNCNDGTANIAKGCGAEVLERHSDSDRGKGFALDAGIQYLRNNPPEVVIVVDADTRVMPGTIDELARAVARTNRPQQSEYLLESSSAASAPRRMAAFAFLIKNSIRPRGLDRLGLPCLLYGAGMAFPWSVIERSSLAHGDITEDIRLAAELARSGHPVAYCPTAQVRSEWPDHDAAARTQRQRWEHGHLRTIAREAPRLLLTGLSRLRPDLVALAFHLGVPPLSFTILAGLLGAAVLFVTGQHAAGWVLLATMGFATSALILAWWKFARNIVKLHDLAIIPVYVIKKVPVYVRFFFRPQKDWVRTGRDSRPQSAMVEKLSGK